MPNKLCVYTCITGDYDDLNEIQHPEKDVDYYCFTNNKNLKSKTWKIVQINDKSLTDHLLSRKIKMLGHPLISKNYNISVWMDASIIWDRSVIEFVKTYFKNSPFAAFEHHARSSIREEAAACCMFRKDSKDSILETLNFLESEHFPDNLGLYEMTVFIKKHNDPKVIKTMNLWFDIIQKYSKRDQLSFMYAIWKTNLHIDPIDLNVWVNEWFHAMKHSPHPEIKDCHVYYGDMAQDFDFSKYHIYPYRQKGNLYSFSATIPCDAKEIELDPAGSIGISYQNLKITPKPTKVNERGFFPIKDQQVSCAGRSTIKIFGDFKKGQKLSFSANLEVASLAFINRLIEELYYSNNYQSQFSSELQVANRKLKTDNERIQKELADILNSKGWRALEKARRTLQIVKRGK